MRRGTAPPVGYDEMTMGATRTSAMVAIAMAIAGCSLLTNTDDLTAGDSSGTVTPDGGAPNGDGGGGGGGDSSAGDGGVVTQGPCSTTKGPEICDDGIDNDCNGLTDCSDPACLVGYECSPTIPAGWTPVAYNSGSPSASCPSGYPTAVDVKRAPSSNTCSCTCSPTNGSCGAGSVSFTPGSMFACNASAVSLPALDGACGTPPSPISVGGLAQVKITPPASPTSCSGTPGTTLPPMEDRRYCAGPTRAGIGCTKSGACVPRTSGSYDGCIMKDGVQTCPSGYSNTRRVGTAPTDTRACGGSCTCSPSSCGGKLELYSSANCSGGKALEHSANDKCESGGNVLGVTGNSYKYVAGSGNGCSATTLTPITGSITFGSEKTICCPPSGD